MRGLFAKVRASRQRPASPQRELGVLTLHIFRCDILSEQTRNAKHHRADARRSPGLLRHRAPSVKDALTLGARLVISSNGSMLGCLRLPIELVRVAQLHPRVADDFLRVAVEVRNRVENRAPAGDRKALNRPLARKLGGAAARASVGPRRRPASAFRSEPTSASVPARRTRPADDACRAPRQPPRQSIAGGCRTGAGSDCRSN